MATFLGVHDFGGPMEEGMGQKSWEKYKESCAKMGIKPIHAHLSDKAGRGYCLTEADSPEEVQKAHDDVGVPVKEIIEVQTAE